MTVVVDTAHPAPAPLRLLVGLGLRGGLFLVADPVLRLPLAELAGGDPLEQLGDGAAEILR
jgi:hypothetical protein